MHAEETRPGGRWLADERGAYEPDDPADDDAGDVCEPATCTLAEAAAAHDGQPVGSWMLMFWRVYGDLD